MPKKPVNTQKGISWREVVKLLTSITGFITSVLVWLDIAQYSQLGFQNFLWAGIFVVIAIWGIILYLLYKVKNTAFSIGLAITIVAIVIVGIWWASTKKAEVERTKARESKFIVVIARFDDENNDYYELRNEIHDALKDTFVNDGSVLIEKIDDTVTEDRNSDSPYARELGENYQADLVIWGSYRETENPNMKIHIENLSTSHFVFIKESDKLEPSLKLSELKSYTFQQQAGQGASALIYFLTGYVDYMASNYESAITRFDNALADPSSQQWFLENYDNVYFYRGTTNLYLENYQRAIQDFDQILGPESNFFE